MESLYSADEFYMRRALQLAKDGAGAVSPNPMVGAVIVSDGKIIGEGYHRKYGEAHAEVNAVNSVKDKRKLKNSTIYVTLEPCAHFGKTPPCCDLIIGCGIPRVVVGCEDPFAKVSGRGIGRMVEAGIDVTTGVLEKECRFLNRRFITCHTEKRPYIQLKWCESLDGFIAKKVNGRPVRTSLSSAAALAWIHAERTMFDAILVGTDTVIVDNPSLTTRYFYGKSPVRCTLDRNGRIPSESNIFSPEGRCIVFAGKEYSPRRNAEIVITDFSKDVIPQIMAGLYDKGITSVIVEGGLHTLQKFIDSGLWDEVRREIAPIKLSDGVKSPCFEHGFDISHKIGGSSVFYTYSDALCPYPYDGRN